jgi:hypothetical protein
MGIRGWFDTKQVDAFAQEVLDDLLKRVPPATLPLDYGKKTGERLHRLTEVMSNRMRAFAVTHRPNFYKRARLGNRVKWGMKDAGYPEAFVEAFTYELVTLMTLASRAPRT